MEDGESLSIASAIDRDGQPISVAVNDTRPAGGTYDVDTGSVTWENLKHSGTYSLRFAAGDFSGTISQRANVAERIACAVISECFPDENLAQAVAKTFNRTVSGHITEDEASSIYYLNYSSSGIQSLEGINLFPNLISLDFSDNRVRDFTGLDQLEKLQTLSLLRNHITDISGLPHSESLIWLMMQDNEIVDVAPLVNFTNLVGLELDTNQISDITPLSEMTKLEVLVLDNNAVSDVSPLSELAQLHILFMSKNRISDISSLESLNHLGILYAANQTVTRDALTISSGGSVSVESGVTADGSHVAITDYAPQGATISDTAATWNNVTEAGEFSLTFGELEDDGEGTDDTLAKYRSRRTGASTRAVDEEVVYFSGTITQPVTIAAEPEPNPEPEPAPEPENPTSPDDGAGTGSGDGAGTDGSAQGGGTTSGGNMGGNGGASTSTDADGPYFGPLARTGADPSMTGLIALAFALLGVGAVMGVTLYRKRTPHQQRDATQAGTSKTE